jgi:hypothetical protein
MTKLEEIIQWQTISGDSTTVGDVTVTPQSQALTIRWPYGGWVWNRPAAVLVERGEQTERIPVVDVTRMAQLGLLGLSLVFSVVIFLLSAQKRRGRNE